MTKTYTIQCELCLDDADMQAVTDLLAAGNRRGAERYIFARAQGSPTRLVGNYPEQILAEWRESEEYLLAQAAKANRS